MTGQEAIKQRIEQVLKSYAEVKVADIHEDSDGATVYLRFGGLKLSDKPEVYEYRIPEA